MSNGDGTSSLGGTVGGRLARLVADASAARAAKTLPTYKRVANEVIGEWFATMDREATEAMQPLLRQIIEDPQTPPEARQLLRAVITPRGQWQMAVARDVAGAATSVGLGAMLNAILGNPIQNVVASFPTALLDPQTAAAADARGLTWDREAFLEARRSGLSSDRYSVLRALARPRPSVPEVLTLLNRREIGRREAEAALRILGYWPDDIPLLLSLRESVLSPQELAEMWNRNIVSTEEGRRIAAMSGVSAGDFDKMTELGGQPLGVQELGEARRRGFIDEARFRRGVVQGPLRNEWFDVLDKLLIRRMSTVDAADAVNQNLMSPDEGRRIARANGLDPDDFSILLDTAGLPPGVSFMQEAFNRGEVNRAEFRQAFLESRTKNKYVDLLERMRIRIIPQETMRLLYREGVTTRARTIRNLQEQGFSAEDAGSLVDLEDRRRITETRGLTRSQIENLYEERIISRDDAVAMLAALGHDDFGIQAILDLADLSRTRKFINAVVTKIRNAYVKRHIDEVRASALLDAAGMPADGRNDLLTLWDIERTTIVRDLTPSQITMAFEDGLFTRQVAMARLQGVSYSAEDAEVLLRLRAPEAFEPATGEGT